MGGWAFYIYVTVIASDTRPFDGLVSFSLTSTGSVLLSRSPRRNHGDGYAERRSKPDAAFIVEGVRGEGPSFPFPSSATSPLSWPAEGAPRVCSPPCFATVTMAALRVLLLLLRMEVRCFYFTASFLCFFVCVYALKKKKLWRTPHIRALLETWSHASN